MKTILLTGVRAPVTLDLARSLAKAGHRVIAAESQSYPLSLRSKAFSDFYSITAPNESLEGFADDLIRIIEKEKVDILIPTCEEAFHVSRVKPVLFSRLSKTPEILVDEFEKLSTFHSKVEFNFQVKKIGLNAPLTIRATTSSEIKEAITRIPGDQVVLKPEFSRFASKTHVLSKGDAQARMDEWANGKAWAVQECLVGKEYCTYSLAQDGKLLAHVTYDHEFTAGKGAGICFQSIAHPAIETWVSTFAQNTGFTGQIAFDFIENEQGEVQPLECNPRATSGLHLILGSREFIPALLRNHETKSLIRPERGSQGQLRLAMLIYGLPSIRSPRTLISWIRIFFTAREVVFSLRDPFPFLDQFVSFFNLLRESRRNKISPLEASTRDIEWNGP